MIPVMEVRLVTLSLVSAVSVEMQARELRLPENCMPENTRLVMDVRFPKLLTALFIVKLLKVVVQKSLMLPQVDGLLHQGLPYG